MRAAASYLQTTSARSGHGLLLAAVGLLRLSQLAADGSYSRNLLPGLVVLGLGNGLAIPAVTLAGLSDVRPADAGLASGLQNAVLQVGGAVGLAALVSLGTARTLELKAAGLPPAAATTAGFDRSFLTGAAVLVAAVVVVMPGLRSPAGALPPVPSAQPDRPDARPDARTPGDL